jgi:aromatic ring-opening dioxygenase LigB subunit
MPLFDAYLAIDWSAATGPKQREDSIWLCLHGDEPENPRTRHEATERVRTLLRGLAAEGRRVLVGFDFPYGYPRGFADAIAPGHGAPWRRVWEELARLVTDDERNTSNRFGVAAELNERLGVPAFWGWPWPDPRLPGRKPATRPLAEFRADELSLRATRRYPKSVWQLSGAGSVGSQALLGLPRVLALRDDPELAPVSAVWPFETGFAAPTAQIVHAEIWPGVIPTRGLHGIRDADQVASLVAWWAALDAAGELAPLFERPPELDDEDADAAVREDGWILGTGARPPSDKESHAGGELVFAAIAPHGGLVFGDPPEAPATRDALEELGRRFAAARPDATIVLTPHNVHVEGHLAVVVAGALAGDASEWTDADSRVECPGDPALAGSVVAELRAAGVPVVGVSFGGNDPPTAEMPLDWGAAIPLHFLGGRADPPVPAVVVSPARDRPLAEHVEAGRALARAVARSGRRVALVASADHGHAHAADGPYGFDPAAAEFDERVIELVRSNRLDDLPGLGDLAAAAKADSLWQLLILHGALGDGWTAELLSYERPTYFGMLCAAYGAR